MHYDWHALCKERRWEQQGRNGWLYVFASRIRESRGTAGVRLEEPISGERGHPDAENNR